MKTLLQNTLALSLGFLLALPLVSCAPSSPASSAAFDGERAYQHILAQVAMGPRTPGSAAHAEFIIYAQQEFENQGWQVTLQQTERMGHPITNILAARQENPPILFMAHYDSRLRADADPNPANHALPVPGANDGASGVAVLLEFARILPADAPVGLLLFDAEDQGNIPGWDWILGSRAFLAEGLLYTPEAVILLDMIGDTNLNIYKEHNSDSSLNKEIWAIAAKLGYQEYFIPEYKYTLLHDHIPFVEAGIPAALLIDFDYPYWDTREDTPDKLSARSLQIVGEVVLAWLEARLQQQ